LRHWEGRGEKGTDEDVKEGFEVGIISTKDTLKRGLQGYRKLRVGDYRVIYKVDKENILILKIGTINPKINL